MAERIADPVRRLTCATGRVARETSMRESRVKSTDELRRLVDAFNSMAAELGAQRVQLDARTASRPGRKWRARSPTRSRTR